eukprot:TRINITY_DN4312_c0_g1_i3.p1 TRINITY_DN4312_c0_g1~~TRINITY_DN4312_c0_g1_i3.p1  ORF type:complete len:310 (-),score=41.20 TRINITY_DN4312_c0_g1_i3:101-1030(-)
MYSAIILIETLILLPHILLFHDQLIFSFFFFQGYGDHRDLHYPLRRQRQMCIRDRYQRRVHGQFNKFNKKANLNQHFQMSKKQVLLSIEGNVGAGKSTFLDLLNSRFSNEFTVIPEPVNEWQNIRGEGVNMLDLLYKDPQRWSYTFQTYAFFSRLQLWQRMMKDVQTPLMISERSVFSDKYIFAQNCASNWNPAELAVYNEWFDFLTGNERYGYRQIDGVIYLRTSPEVCLSRIAKRGRKEEDSIPIDYLTQLHQRHEEWLNSDRGRESHAILTIDNDNEIYNNPDLVEMLINQVKSFIDKISFLGQQE